MRSDLQIIIDIIKAWAGIKRSEKENIGDLLDELSKELQDLAENWNQILIELEKNPNQYPYELSSNGYLRQRSNFHALYGFIENCRKSRNKRVNKIEPFCNLIIDALNEKGKLFCLVKELVRPDLYLAEYPEHVWFENPWLDKINEMERIKSIDTNAPSLSKGDRSYFRFLKRAVERQEKDEHFIQEKRYRENVTKLILEEFRKRVANLMDMSGNFRSQVISYKHSIKDI